MRTRLVVGFAFATLGVSAVACSSSPNPYAEVSEFCTAYAKAVCQVATSCQFDVGTCQTYQQGQCVANAPSASSTTRSYQPANFQACIDALNNAYGNNATAIPTATVQTYTQLCDAVFPGTVLEGDPCTTNLDCANTADVCASAPGSTANICVTPSPKAVNDPCADPGDQCPADSYCAQKSGAWTCVASQGQNQQCSSTLPCNSETTCVGGFCVLPAIGQDCTPSTNCGTFQGEALFCDLYTDTQEPTPQCVDGYSFARGSVDCLGVEGDGTPAVEPDSGTSGGDAGGVGDAGDGGPTVNDAAAGG
jgi:hypothetical protein